MRRVPSFRFAVAASLALHVALGVVVWVAVRPAAAPDRAAAPLDTRVSDMPIRFAEPVEPAVEVVVPVEKPPSAEVPTPSVPAVPIVRTVPRAALLPPELLALVKRPGPVGEPVVEVPLSPMSSSPPMNPVQPTAAVVTAPAAIHGALRPGQSIVYVLDASGSMGEAGKFAAARHALLATIRAQPESVRIQVVVYASTASAILPGIRCVPATAEAAANVERALAVREPAGRSDHAAGLALAAEMRPDFVLLFTDAWEVTRANYRSVLARFPPHAAICVARAAGSGLGPVVELR